MDLTTVPDVEIVSTGTYELGSGQTTFTEADLADAVRAATDPTVRAPRIKLGHEDPRFDDDLDGEPAFGTVTNMRLDENGQTIKADLTNVPTWLADSMKSAFPGRSIEGAFGFKAPSGHDYKLAISKLALLGTTWPGVTSLKDLQDCLSANGPVLDPVAANGAYTIKGEKGDARAQRIVMAKVGRTVTAALDEEDEEEVKRLMREGKSRAEAVKLVEESEDEREENRRTKRTKARIDLGGLNRIFAKDLLDGKVPAIGDPNVAPQSKWWPRSVQAEGDKLALVIDDDKGHLLELPFTVEGETVSYSTPAIVKQTSAPLAASGDTGPRILASWPSIQAARPEQEAQMNVDQGVLRKRLGLPEDADEAAITAALTADPPAPTTARTGSIPEGAVIIDKQTLDELRSGAKAGSEVAASLAKQEKETTIVAAIKAGRFAVGRRAHYEKMWDADPEGTRQLLTAKAEDGGLAPGTIPVNNEEIGSAGDGDGNPAEEEQVLASIGSRLFPELAEVYASANGGAS